MNQHSYPHWDGLECSMTLRLPDEVKDGIETYARADGISQAEWIRRTLADRIAERTEVEANHPPSVWRK